MKIKLLTRILAILGFGSAFTSCITPDMYGPAPMYGPPDSWFTARGEVTDEAGEPIIGIKVSSPDVEYGSAYTGTDGQYNIQCTLNNDATSILLEFDDIDGAENGGDFASTAVSVERVEYGTTDVPTVVMTLKSNE